MSNIIQFCSKMYGNKSKSFGAFSNGGNAERVPENDFSVKLETPLSFSVSKNHTRRTAIKRALKGLQGRTVQRFVNWYNRMMSTHLIGKFTKIAMRLDRDNFRVEMKYKGSLNNFYATAYMGGYEHQKRPAILLYGSNHDQQYNGQLHPRKVRQAIKDLIEMSRHSDLLYPRYFKHPK
ncbi:MAG: hypothetical protein ACPGOY_11510 [Rhodospirillaceae bacterium]